MKNSHEHTSDNATPREDGADHPGRGVRMKKDDGPRQRFRKQDLQRLGRFLVAQRQGADMTLRGLSERSGVSIGAIRALEAGQSNPSLATVVAVVDALGVSLDRMMASLRPDRQDIAVVTRAGSGETVLSRGLGGAVLSAQFVELAGDSLNPPPGDATKYPGFGMVLAGAALARLGDGRRVRLAVGDAWHARLEQVITWAGAEAARMLHVADTRNDAAGDKT